MTDSNFPLGALWPAEPPWLAFLPASPPVSAAPPDTELLRQLGFVPGLKEALMVRQVHALEHATVWVLAELARSRPTAIPSPDLLGGLSTDRGFFLYGPVPLAELRRAVQTALQRLTEGDGNLAIHPRCGTNLSVGLALTGGFAIGLSLLLPRDPLGQLLGLGTAVTLAAQLAPELGGLAQRHITTAIPFNLAIEQVSAVAAHQGQPTHFVQVSWID
jgi:hypothetical protein